jgi:hypothetical protein
MFKFIKSIISGGKTIAAVDTDEFRLSRKNFWTEPDHPQDAGSTQQMRLEDENIITISVSIETIKVFASPLVVTDISQFIELKSLSIKNGSQRLSLLSYKERIAEDLLLLEKMRKAISWPKTLDELIVKLTQMPSTISL